MMLMKKTGDFLWHYLMDEWADTSVADMNKPVIHRRCIKQKMVKGVLC